MQSSIALGLLLSLSLQACYKQTDKNIASGPAPKPRQSTTSSETNKHDQSQDQQLEDKLKQIEDLQTALDEKQATIKDNNERISELEDLLEEADSDRESLESQIARLQDSNSELQAEVQQLNQTLMTLNRQLDKAKRQLEEKQIEVVELKKERDEGLAKVQSLNERLSATKQELAAAKQRLSEFENSEEGRLIAELEAQVKTLQASLDEEKHKLDLSSVSLDRKQEEVNRLKQDLLTIEKRLTEARNDRSTLLTTIENQRNEIENYKDYTVRLALDALGKERLFVVQDYILTQNYSLATNQNCALMLQFDDQAQRYTGEGISGFELSPYALAYKKIVVCQQDNEMKAQQESGVVVKAYPSNGSRLEGMQLISRRLNSSCNDNANSIFSSNLQLLYPYSASIDALETLGVLMPRGTSIEYNMGSSTPGVFAPDCTKFLNSPFADRKPLLKAACELAVGDESNIVMGCHLEQKHDDQYIIQFNASN